MRFSFITQDLSLKLFSLLVAGLLYVFVTVENAVPVDVEFPIEFRTDEDIMLTGDYPTMVNATLQGPWAGLRQFEASRLEPLVVDLRGAGPGTLRHRIEIGDVHAPGGMKVVSVRPSDIEVTLDRKVERQVPVSVDLGAERPAFGYEIIDTRTEPARARVVGPMSTMRALDFVYTKPLAVGGRTSDLVADVELRSPPAPFRLKDRQVHVVVEIGEEQVSRRLSDIPVKAKNKPDGVRVRFVPETVSVTLKGPRRAIDALDPKLLFAEVDLLPEMGQGVTEFEKTIDIAGKPDKTLVTGVVPKVVAQLTRIGKARRK